MQELIVRNPYVRPNNLAALCENPVSPFRKWLGYKARYLPLTHLEEPRILKNYCTGSYAPVNRDNIDIVTAKAMAVCIDELNRNGAEIELMVDIYKIGEKDCVNFGFAKISFEHARDLAHCERILMYGCSENDFLRFVFELEGGDLKDWHPFGNVFQKVMNELYGEKIKREPMLL